ncbi:MAG: C10 family peptidase [Sphingobacteriaceae bacterium]|nr:C10 family peptidase [Sphingobacteriaceae bacterium]
MKILALLPLLIFSTVTVNGQVAPFVTATWNQTCYYNALTPTVASGGSCGRAYTGCNATALAMICKYYNWPSNGIGGTYCNSNFTTNCVNFGAQTYSYSCTN